MNRRREPSRASHGRVSSPARGASAARPPRRRAALTPAPSRSTERGQARVVEAAELGEVGGRGVRRLQLPGRATPRISDAGSAMTASCACQASRRLGVLRALAQAGGLRRSFPCVASPTAAHACAHVVGSVPPRRRETPDEARREAQRRWQQQRKYCENHQPSPRVRRKRTRGSAASQRLTASRTHRRGVRKDGPTREDVPTTVVLVCAPPRQTTSSTAPCSTLASAGRSTSRRRRPDDPSTTATTQNEQAGWSCRSRLSRGADSADAEITALLGGEYEVAVSIGARGQPTSLGGVLDAIDAALRARGAEASSTCAIRRGALRDGGRPQARRQLRPNPPREPTIFEAWDGDERSLTVRHYVGNGVCAASVARSGASTSGVARALCALSLAPLSLSLSRADGGGACRRGEASGGGRLTRGGDDVAPFSRAGCPRLGRRRSVAPAGAASGDVKKRPPRRRRRARASSISHRTSMALDGARAVPAASARTSSERRPARATVERHLVRRAPSARCVVNANLEPPASQRWSQNPSAPAAAR